MGGLRGEPEGPPDRPLLELMLGPRLALVAALAGITVLCWLYLFAEAADMRAMGDMTMAMPPKGAVDLVLLLVTDMAMGESSAALSRPHCANVAAMLKPPQART